MIPEAVRLERERRKAAREARAWEREKLLYDRLLTPNVVRLALVAGIIGYSTYVTRSDRNMGPIHSALALTLPTIGIPLIAADAGVRDKYALLGLGAAAAGFAGAEAMQGLSVQGQLAALAGTIPVIGPTLRGILD